MPRKKFLEDFAAAASHRADHIHDLCKGEDDGQVQFLWTCAELQAPVKVFATVDDIGSYPTSHNFLVYTDDDAPPDAAYLLQKRVSDRRRNCSLADLLSHISKVSGSAGPADCTSELVSEDDADDSDVDMDMDFDELSSALMDQESSRTMEREMRKRMRSDLAMLRQAGYRVGFYGAFLQNASGVLAISQRVRASELSIEATGAWSLNPNHYFVLLIRYPNGYRSLEELLQPRAQAAQIELRFGLCEDYKPTREDAFSAFDKSHGSRLPEERAVNSTFRDTFISASLNKMINEDLLALLELRHAGLSWSQAEAEHYCPDSAARSLTSRSQTKNDTADRFADEAPLSLPLLAIQFTLRRFLHCTEYCLVCHRKLNEEFEALKPYVCELPLCLYQYMQLGFGPRIEHEILTQPLVVDLLVSCCYNSAFCKAIPDFPSGLGILLPASFASLTDSNDGHLIPPAAHATRTNWPASIPEGCVKLKLDIANLEAVAEGSIFCPFRKGDWVVIQPATMKAFHCCVTEVECWPKLHFTPPVEIRTPGLRVQPNILGTAAGRLPTGTVAVCQKYDVDFDVLPNKEKFKALTLLLDTLPGVNEMKDFLKLKGKNLKQWTDRISPSALAVLRWVIASNRSCILQVDGKADLVAGDAAEERVHGMPGWVQFRWAMGRPDKERRFVSAVRSTTQRLNLEHPTLFAWHGSPLQNWHSIVRHGLNFDVAVHGRAYGDGVYHSQQQSTSLGYCQAKQFGDTRGVWPSSTLLPSAAMSLNEIVNAPTEFVSSSPHLVVKQLDWIQTRYLFVQSAAKLKLLPEKDVAPNHAHVQDPSRTPVGETGPIIIPAKAIMPALRSTPSIKRKPVSSTAHQVKKHRGTTAANPVHVTASYGEAASENKDDGDSQSTLSEDRSVWTVLECSGIEQESILLLNSNGTSERPPCRFVPGVLNHSSLPIMAEPAYAHQAATRRLQRDFRDLLKVQNSTHAADLGWYIDPQQFENVYQWIVELHSFDQFQYRGAKLPLATDMEKAGIQSIVLEVRFPDGYPMAPPFVRVIQPRLLGFQQGGGGHVTSGGAMCMELLTNSGWTAVTTMEAVLLQIRLAIASTDPFPARLDPACFKDMSSSLYGIGEAVEAYKRSVRMHGWTMPPEFDRMGLTPGVKQAP